jgi:hypothetical protein
MTEMNTEKQEQVIRLLWLQMEALFLAVGLVPAQLTFDYLTPLSWASIEAIASKI